MALGFECYGLLTTVDFRFARNPPSIQGQGTRSLSTSRHIGTNPTSVSALAIYHSSRMSIGKVKPVFCFSIVRNNQAKGISTAGTLHGQVRRSPSEKRSFVEPPIMEARIIAHMVFSSY